MNNILSYSGLVDVRINASDKDLPVKIMYSEEATIFFSITHIGFDRPIPTKKLVWGIGNF